MSLQPVGFRPTEEQKENLELLAAFLGTEGGPLTQSAVLSQALDELWAKHAEQIAVWQEAHQAALTALAEAQAEAYRLRQGAQQGA